jgi:hypothetical protein
MDNEKKSSVKMAASFSCGLSWLIGLLGREIIDWRRLLVAERQID